jgi:hypothetical protein
MQVKKTLDNGISFTITEHSRLLAADRWYVKVVGTIALPLTEAAFASIAEEDQALKARVRRRLGDGVEHHLVQERNFVDGAAKDEVVRQLVEQLAGNIGTYLAVEEFPARLLASKYRAARETCRVEMGREKTLSGSDEEPADFSHCFR